MITFLAGGTGTPKLLAGATEQLSAERLTVIGNTGDDIELGGLVVCPDLDTVLFHQGGVLDTDRWWGVDGDSHETNAELLALADAAGLPGHAAAARARAAAAGTGQPPAGGEDAPEGEEIP